MTNLEVGAADFTEYLRDPTDEDSEYAADIYDHMAGFCLKKVLEQSPALHQGPARSGYRVMTRLLKFASALYPDYAHEHGVEPTVEDLSKILLNSTQTPIRFAHLSRKTNNQVEHAFGLATAGMPMDLEDMYHFETNTSRGTLFIADDDRFADAFAEGRLQDPDFSTSSKCPMAEITRKVLWPNVVRLAAEAPEAFAHDLSL